MSSTVVARRLLRDQTDEEKQLWRALKAGRFAGFKFRRQHPKGKYFLDFYCPAALLSVELDGFQHGVPEYLQRDDDRARFLATEALRSCASGIINGRRTVRACCWKSGRCCTGGRVA